MVATNGLLVDDETIAMCKKYKVMIAVGLDGPKKRMMFLGLIVTETELSDRIVASIRKLVGNGIRTFVRQASHHLTLIRYQSIRHFLANSELRNLVSTFERTHVFEFGRFGWGGRLLQKSVAWSHRECKEAESAWF